MAFTYDTTTSRGRVRLLIGDTNTGDATKQIFDDDEMDAFLALENQDVFMAAASACLSIANDASRSAVAYSTLGMSINRQRIPEHYRKQAEMFRDRATNGEPQEFFDFADHNVNDWGQDFSEYDGDVY